MAELAASGGVLVVDPYNDSDLTDALRRVLTDDDLHARLSHEAVGREHRGWEQYASDLWSCLVKPELSEPDLVPVRTTRATNPVS
jgi:hypothetical protein